MNFEALTNAGWIVYGHALVALFSLVIGAVQLTLKKGTTLHRHLGRIWVVIMAVTALSSFGIHEIRMLGPFSIIHLLSILVLYSLWEGIHKIRKGDVQGHRKAMIALYIYAMLITGALTLLPGRIMNTVVFG